MKEGLSGENQELPLAVDNYLWDTERGYSGSSNFTGNTFSTNTTTAEQSGEHVRNIYEDGYQSWGGYHIKCRVKTTPLGHSARLRSSLML